MADPDPQLRKLVQILVYAHEYRPEIVSAAQKDIAAFHKKDVRELAVDLFAERADAYIKSLGNPNYVRFAKLTDLPKTILLPKKLCRKILADTFKAAKDRKALLKTDYGRWYSYF